MERKHSLGCLFTLYMYFKFVLLAILASFTDLPVCDSVNELLKYTYSINVELSRLQLYVAFQILRRYK